MMSKPSEQWQAGSTNANNLNNRLRLPRIMPQWMKNANTGRFGPPPPPPPTVEAPSHSNSRPTLRPKSPADPDYEVIEFPNQQQYMNTNINVNDAGKNKNDTYRCDLCGSLQASVRCVNCNGQTFCTSCDEMYHRHPKRQTHVRQNLPNTDQDNALPPLPPKGIMNPPIPPPRRNKVASRTDNFGSTLNRKSIPFDKTASLSKLLTRPLPAIPPNLNFVQAKKSNQVENKEIVTNTSLQQRYKRHLDMMRGKLDISRDFSNVKINQNKPEIKPNVTKDNIKNLNNWDQSKWNTLPHNRTPHLTEDINKAPLMEQRTAFQSEDLKRPMSPLQQRIHSSRKTSMSSSVFDLNSPMSSPTPFIPQQFHPSMQAQSMAQLGCVNCHHHCTAPPQDWSQWNRRFGSNTSLNIPSEAMHQAPMWMGPWCGMSMYPLPMMHPQHHVPQDMHMASRTQSRINSRAPSPTTSIRSRRSRISRKTNIEDEDISDTEDDRKSQLQKRKLKGDQHKRTTLDENIKRSTADNTENILQRKIDTKVEVHLDNKTTENIIQKDTFQNTQQIKSESLSQESCFTEDADLRTENIDKNNTEIPDKLDAPPPPTPQHSWVCEYCTYVNEAGVRVCEVCCKTPTAPPIPSQTNELSVKTKKISSSESCIYEYSDAENYNKRKKNSSAKQAPKATPESDSNDESISCVSKKGNSVTNNFPKTNVKDQQHNQTSDTNKIINNSTSQNTESTARIRTVKRKNLAEKKSTGCGPSPPKDIELQLGLSNGVKPTKEKEITKEKKETTSTGTSPLPQSISTQTYDILENVKKSVEQLKEIEKVENASTKATDVEKNRKQSYRPFRRSNSLRGATPSKDIDQWTMSQKSDRSVSHLSYSSDSHSLPPTPPREESPPPFIKYEDLPGRETKHLNQLGPFRSRSNSVLGPGYITGVGTNMGNPITYRSIVDLHKPDLYRDDNWRQTLLDPYFIQNSRNNYMGYDGDPQQHDIITQMSIDHLIQRRQSDAMKTQGMELVKLLKEAELNNFSPEELQIAMTNSGAQNPITWLKENWSNMVETVYTVATNYGRECTENTVGTISQREARDALKKHKGSVWKAVTECVEQRQKKFKDLESRGKFSREDILTCLTAHHGDLEAAFLELSKTQLKPFLMRIWGPPSGAENESGNLNNKNIQHLPNALKDNHKGEDLRLSDSLNEYSKLYGDQTTDTNEAEIEDNQLVSSIVSLQNDPSNSFKSATSPSPFESSKFINEHMLQNGNSSTVKLLNDLQVIIQHVNTPDVKNNVLNNINAIKTNIKESKQINNENIINDENNNNNEIFVDSIDKKDETDGLKKFDTTKVITNFKIIDENYVNEEIQEIQEATVPYVATFFPSIKEVDVNSTSQNICIIKTESINFHPEVKVINNNEIAETEKSEDDESEESESESFSEESDSSSEESENNYVENDAIKTPSQNIVLDPQHNNARNDSPSAIIFTSNNIEEIDYIDIEFTSEATVMQNEQNEIEKMEKNDVQENAINITTKENVIETFNEKNNTSIKNEKQQNQSENIQEDNKNNINIENHIKEKVDNNKISIENQIENNPENYEIQKKSQLVDIVEDTQKLIHLMRDEIQLDIASYDSMSSTEESDEEYDTSDSSAIPASSIHENSQEYFSNSENDTISDEVEEEEEEEEMSEGDSDYEEESDENLNSNEIKLANNFVAVNNLKNIINNKKDLIQNTVHNNEISVVNDKFNNEDINNKNTLIPSPNTINIQSNLQVFEEVVQNLQDQINSIETRGFVVKNNLNNENIPQDITKEIEILNSLEKPDNNALNNNVISNSYSNGNTIFEDTIDNNVTVKINLPNTIKKSADISETASELLRSPENNLEINHSRHSTVSNDSQNSANISSFSPDHNNKIENHENINKPDLLNNSHINNNNNNELKQTISEKQNLDNAILIIESPPKNNLNIQLDEQNSTNENKINNFTSNTNTNKNEITNDKNENEQTNNNENNAKKALKPFVSQIPKLEKNTNKKLTTQKPSPKNNTEDKSNITIPKPIAFNTFQSGNVKKLQQGIFNKVNVLSNKQNEKQSPKIPVLINSKRIVEKNTQVSPLSDKINASKNSTENIPSNITKNNEKTDDKQKVGKLKPYFVETCLSDDYFTDDDGKHTTKSTTTQKPLQVSNNVPTIKSEVQNNPSQLVLNDKFDNFTTLAFQEECPERQIRMLLAEGLVPSWEQAEVAVQLHKMNYDEATALQTAKDCTTLEAAIAYLQQECELCMGKYPVKDMVSMLKCIHRCCKECAKNYFTIQVTDRSIIDCTCPFCKLPELQNQHEDDVLEYFSNLDILLKNILEENVHELFQRKLRDRTLMQDPNFKWCVECSSGFIANPKQRRLMCPDCRSITCAHCRKPWELQHDGISCEKFAEWKEANDPDKQIACVKKHLDDHGIDCPKCHFRYSLSRGGCMHFTCTQCKYEFCCGCKKPFMMGAKCGVSPYCAKLGLHSHHPRNCLFYLRDKEPQQLQNLLQINNIEFKTNDPNINNEENKTNSPRKCPVLLQRETPNGLVDGVCNSEVIKSHAGLCKIHYVEYLVGLMRTVDPLPIMDLSEMVSELRRLAIPLPERGPWDTDPIYVDMCAKIIKEKIPLE